MLLVYDGTSECPYLPSRISRTPLKYPIRPLTPDEVDRRLAAGYRRQGVLLYHMACPNCEACEPIRLPVERFYPSKTQRRVLRRGQAFFDIEIGTPEYSE